MDKFTGRVWVLGDDIDTDIIIPTEYLALKTIDDMKQYGFSPLRPELAGQIQKGDIIVAGKNFGCGSSREQAPEIIKAMGVQCVIAKSFARIFLEAYYETVFRKEEMILRPYLIRVIQNEKRKCQAEGLWNWIGKIHTRLQVEETEVIYLKNHEFKYKKKELNTVFLTVSTFVYPHLWLFKHRQELEVVKGVIVESIESDIPEDLVQIFKVLGDKTRLRIIKLLMQNVCTTQELAQKLEISEAAVSKHLQIMWKADLVHKNKKGFFVEYEFKEDMINYIPYKFYEMITI